MLTSLRENIDWVGYVDWTVRDFHSYHTILGATYNAFLIRDEKTALIDTVKAPHAERLLENIAALKPDMKIDYVVCNHAEPDHAGGLSQVLAAIPDATLICNRKCHDILSAYNEDAGNWKVQIVADGETLSLGNRSLTFINTPMVHWPESMFTYVPEERLLFSMDAFGQHLATSQRFDDEVEIETAMEEARKYYANIVMPYGRQVAKILDKAADLEIDMIAPSHGVIWRTGTRSILDLYRRWAEGAVRPKVLVLYDTMWQSTEKMAQAIVDGASLPGVEVTMLSIRTSDLTEIATEAMESAAIALGSSTLNSHAMPAVASVMNYLGGLRVKNKVGIAFGSAGWGPGAVKEIAAWMDKLSWDQVDTPIKSVYRPTSEIIEQCKEAGRKMAAMHTNG